MQRFAAKRDLGPYIIWIASVIAIILAGVLMLLFPEQQLVSFVVIFMAIVMVVLSLLPLRVKAYELREDRIVVVGTGIEVPYESITDVSRGWIIAQYKSAYGMISRGHWGVKRNMFTASAIMTRKWVFVVTDKSQYLMTPVDDETFVKELNKMIGKTQPE